MAQGQWYRNMHQYYIYHWPVLISYGQRENLNFLFDWFEVVLFALLLCIKIVPPLNFSYLPSSVTRASLALAQHLSLFACKTQNNYRCSVGYCKFGCFYCLISQFTKVRSHIRLVSVNMVTKKILNLFFKNSECLTHVTPKQ